MKTTLFLIIFLLAGMVVAQDLESMLNRRTFAKSFLFFWDDYQKECVDTIRATMFEGEYLIDRGDYRELMSAKQLEDKGYKYKYRWITNTKQPFEFEYI